jgi:signal transduction histidine kinase
MSVPFIPYRRNLLLRSIPDDLFEKARIEPELVTYEADVIVFDEGDAADACYLVESGAIGISKAGHDGRHETISFLGPGEFFGEMGLIDTTVRSARATATTRTVAARLDREAFDRLRQAAPLEVISVLAEVSAARVRATNAHLVRKLDDAGRLREIGAALGTIAHNLRSPLATVQNTAELLEELLPGEISGRDYLVRLIGIIQRTTRRALEASDQLLAELRGELPTERAYIRTDEIVAEALEQVAGLVRGSAVRVVPELRTSAGIHVDRNDFVAALVNLLRNAIEALPASGGTVRIVTEEHDHGVRIVVADSGAGISPENLGQIFEPRFTHGKPGGTGLGLAHVKAVVARHGGRIEVESEPGIGTTVCITLPGREDPPGAGRTD